MDRSTRVLFIFTLVVINAYHGAQKLVCNSLALVKMQTAEVINYTNKYKEQALQQISCSSSLQKQELPANLSVMSSQLTLVVLS